MNELGGTLSKSDDKFNEADRKALSSLYSLAISARDLEINQLVQRNNFFMIFQGVLFAGLLQAAGNGKIIPIVSFLVCFIGLATSLLQVGMACGAKFWQERWEHAVESIEKFVIKAINQNAGREALFEIFSSGDEHINKIVKERMKDKLIGRLVVARFSPSRIPIYAAFSFALVWVILLGVHLFGAFGLQAAS